MSPHVGSHAPDFTASDQDGQTVRLANLRGKPVVLYFYPRASTPGCTIEARKFRDAYARIQELGAVVLGVSPDTIKAQKKFQINEGLPFPLLADADRTLALAYGVIREKSMYGRLFKGVSRMTFIIDGEGVVRRVFEQVKPKEHAAEVIAALEELGTASLAPSGDEEKAAEK